MIGFEKQKDPKANGCAKEIDGEVPIANEKLIVSNEWKVKMLVAGKDGLVGNRAYLVGLPVGFGEKPAVLTHEAPRFF